MTRQSTQVTIPTTELEYIYDTLEAAENYISLADAQRSILALAKDVAVSPLAHELRESLKRIKLHLFNAQTAARRQQEEVEDGASE